MILLALALIIPAGQPFTCRVTGVHDGDGPIYCQSGVKVRLAAIAAREIDETCRSNQPCPLATAAAAKRALEQIVDGYTLACVSRGKSYGRTIAWCSAPQVGDVSCAMLRTGTVLRWPRYDRERRLCR